MTALAAVLALNRVSGQHSPRRRRIVTPRRRLPANNQQAAEVFECCSPTGESELASGELTTFNRTTQLFRTFPLFTVSAVTFSAIIKY